MWKLSILIPKYFRLDWWCWTYALDNPILGCFDVATCDLEPKLLPNNHVDNFPCHQNLFKKIEGHIYSNLPSFSYKAYVHIAMSYKETKLQVEKKYFSEIQSSCQVCVSNMESNNTTNNLAQQCILPRRGDAMSYELLVQVRAWGWVWVPLKRHVHLKIWTTMSVGMTLCTSKGVISQANVEQKRNARSHITLSNWPTWRSLKVASIPYVIQTNSTFLINLNVFYILK